jgi:hypothetical protein
MDNFRKNIVQYIFDSIVYIEDENINMIYDKINIYVPTKKNLSDRIDKIKYIENSIKYIKKNDLNEIKLMVEKSLIYIESIEEKKHRIVLEILNKMLDVMGKNKIKDLIEFIDIKRERIIDNDIKKIIQDNIEYIFNNGFNKSECMLYQKHLKNQHLSILKGIIKEIGYELISKNKTKHIDKKKTMITEYSIQKSSDI